MRCWFWICSISLLLFLGCSGKNHSGSAGVPGLYLWSRQPTASSQSQKAILFIHGRRGNVPDQNVLEELFAFKLANLDALGKERFGCRTSELAKFWLYAYNPQQPVDQIAADLASAIRANSELSDNQIAVVAYSEGGVVAWLLDQSYEGLIKGGVLLGAPILSTPLAHPAVRNAAIQEIVPSALQDYAISAFETGTLGTEFLQPIHYEDCTAKSDLAMFAGQVEPLNPSHIVADLIMGYSALLNDQQPNREAAKLGALLIQHSVWNYTTSCQFPNGYKDSWCLESDGVVPVASALWGAGDNCRIWSSYDHYDLLTGQGALELDQATLDQLDHVLQLMPPFLSGGDIPALPEITITLPMPLSKARFAYTLDGQVYLADKDWSANPISAFGGASYPRFSPDSSKLVWTQATADAEGIYLLEGAAAKAVATTAVARYADFSPNGKWLVYQGGDELRIKLLSEQQELCIVKGVELVCPPLWVTKGLVGRIYFVSQSPDGITDLYVVSPRARNKTLSELEMVTPNCSSIFLARGMISGVVASSGTALNPRFTVVSKLLQANISLELQSGVNTPSFSWDNLSFKIGIADPLLVQSAVLDQSDDYALYVDTNTGIQLFSITAQMGLNGLTCDYALDEICPGAHQLDINPAAGT